MKRKRRILGVWLMVSALIIMLLPATEADAETSASAFQIEGSTLVKYRGTDTNVSIPGTVKTIGRSAFEDNTKIELVVVPNSVTSIEAYAFWGCDRLDTVVLGKGLRTIGDFAFAGAKGLVQMTIPSTVSSIGVQAFGDCVNMRDISIPPETLYIHETAFDGCARLTIHCDAGSAADSYAKDFYERQKEMPEYEDVSDYDPTATPVPSPSPDPTPEPGNLLGTTQIVGNKAVFLLDNKIPKVYEAEPAASQIPWEEGQFGGISAENGGTAGSLSKYTIVDGKVVADQAYYRNATLGAVTLPDGIREVGQFAFARSSVTSAVLPEGVETIGYGAFYHCDNLGEVTLPGTVLCVEPKAFTYTRWVESFLDGEGESSGGDFLMSGGVLVAYRGNAADVRIPSDVRVIAGEVFLNHTEIRTVSLPDSLLVVGEGAFEGCVNLGQIAFGKNVETIKDRAFYGNTAGRVTLPASVREIGLKAFGDAVVDDGGREVTYTHETSAARLSNADYRVYGQTDSQTLGVTVSGLEETFGPLEGLAALASRSSLAGADRSFTLTVRKTEAAEEMKAAFRRSYRTAMPEDMAVYDLSLTDSSGIPLKKLGRQALSVVLPVPESLRGQELALFTLDRNGQLEIVAAERVTADGIESFRFQTSHLSLFGVCGIGKAESEAVVLAGNMEAGESMEPPLDMAEDWTAARLCAGGAVLTAGMALFLAGGRRRTPRRVPRA